MYCPKCGGLLTMSAVMQASKNLHISSSARDPRLMSRSAGHQRDPDVIRVVNGYCKSR